MVLTVLNSGILLPICCCVKQNSGIFFHVVLWSRNKSDCLRGSIMKPSFRCDIRSWATLYDTFLIPASTGWMAEQTCWFIQTHLSKLLLRKALIAILRFLSMKKSNEVSVDKSISIQKNELYIEFSGEFVSAGPTHQNRSVWSNLTDPHPTVDLLTGMDGGHEKHLTALESTRGQVAELQKNHAPGRRFREWLKTVSAKVSAVSMFFWKIKRFTVAVSKKRGCETLWIAEAE